MKAFWIALALFGIIVIVFPALLVFLIGGFFIIVGLNIFVFAKKITGKGKKNDEDYVKFGNYKIYR